MVETVNIPIERIKQSKIDQVDFNNIPFGKVYSDHMFLADYKNGEWTDLRIQPYAPLSLSPATTTLHYAQSIFEGMKAYKTESGEVTIFRPDANAKRLNKSAQRMCIPEVPVELFMSALNTLLALDKQWVPDIQGTALYIRPFVFATDDYIGIRPSDNYTFMIITCPVGAYYSEPVKVKIETHYTRAAAGGTGSAKAAGNYAASLYPAKLAQEQGYDQLVWTDALTHEYIEESGTMNIIFKIGNKIITPATSDSILHGITRDSVLTLAREWGYEVEERKVSVKEVITAAQNGTLQEAFGAGTAATIAQISLIANEGIDYALPAIETREFSNRIGQTLDNIKYGRVEDNHGWLYSV